MRRHTEAMPFSSTQKSSCLLCLLRLWLCGRVGALSKLAWRASVMSTDIGANAQVIALRHTKIGASLPYA
jgi:hypothetical protein